MNKGRTKNIIFLALALLIVACATPKEDQDNDGAEQAEWAGMDDFHMVMAETFHPYKDSSNLEPVKSRAGELAAVAENWANEPLPPRVDNDDMKKMLQELQDQIASLVQLVSTGNDEAIGSQLTKVHDTFHAIQEDWYGGSHEDQH